MTEASRLEELVPTAAFVQPAATCVTTWNVKLAQTSEARQRALIAR